MGSGERQRSLLDNFFTPVCGTNAGWGLRRLGHRERVRKPEGEVLDLCRAVRFGERNERPGDGSFPSCPDASCAIRGARAPVGGLAGPRLTCGPEAPRPGGRCPTRAACASLPALPLAPGCCRGKSLLLATSFRLSGESVNSTFLISESLEKSPSTAAGCTPGPGASAPRAAADRSRRAGCGVRGAGEAGRRRKRDREQRPS